MQKTSIKTPLSQYLYLTLLPINIKKSNVMYNKMKDHLCKELAEIKEAGLYKEERIIESPQRAAIEVKGKEFRTIQSSPTHRRSEENDG